MKLPRYPTGRTAVSELGAARDVLPSPQEAAQAELAKTDFVSDIAGIAAETSLQIGEIRKKAQQADDAVRFETGETLLSAALKQLENDPNLKQPVQEDGTPTPEYYQREADAILQTYREHGEKYTDPQFKKAALAKIRNREIMERANISANIGVIETRIAANNFFDGFQIAMEHEDTDAAFTLIDIAKEQNLITQAKAMELQNLTDTKRVEVAARGYIEQVDAAYAESQEAGDEALANLIKSQDITDEDVKRQAVDGAERMQIEWGKAYEKERVQAQVVALRNFTRDERAAKRRETTEKQIMDKYYADEYGNHESVEATEYMRRLLTAYDSGLKAEKIRLDIEGMINRKEKIPRNKEAYDGLAAFEQQAVEGMSLEETIENIANISRVAGTVSTVTNHALVTNASDVESAMQSIDLYLALTEDADNLPDLRLDRDSRILYETAAELIRNNVPKDQALKIAWGHQHLSEDEKTENRIAWKETGQDDFRTDYKGFVETNYGLPFLADVFGGEVEKPPLQMQIEYESIYQKVYEQTRNKNTARTIANDAMKRTWVRSNLNSQDPNNFQIVKFGVPGDSQYVRKAIIRSLQDESSIQIQQPDGTYKRAKLNPDTLTFETFPNEIEAYDKEGRQRFKVKQDGVPLTRITDAGPETLVVKISREKLEEHRQISEKREKLENRLREIKNEEDHLRVMTEENIYRDSDFDLRSLMSVGRGTITKKFPTRRERQEARRIDLQQERKRIESELPKMQVDF